jgi:hypothetical protein
MITGLYPVPFVSGQVRVFAVQGWADVAVENFAKVKQHSLWQKSGPVAYSAKLPVLYYLFSVCFLQSTLLEKGCEPH